MNTDYRVRWATALTALAVLLISSAAALAQVTLVANGKPSAVIVLPEKPHPDEATAAAELIEHIRLISGAVLPTATGKAPAGQAPIYLGGAADAALEQVVRERGNNPSAFALIVDGGSVAIRGLSAEGTLFGAYELLEQLGVRWYMPGELGRVIPKTATITLANQRNVQAPSFDQRTLQHVGFGEWPRRVRLGGEHRSTGAHGIPPFQSGAARTRLFAEHPEYFALIGGKRLPRQLCVSNPEVLKLTIQAVRAQLQRDPQLKYVGMGPDDGSGYCECANCRALDGAVIDPFFSSVSMTDRYIWYYNQILTALEADYPQLHIVTHIYAAHMMPPRAVTPHPRIVAVFAPISLDRIRGMDNPMSPDRYVLRWILDEWSKFKLHEMYYRGYYNNLACPQFPISQVDRIRHETPAFRERGINVMRVEVIHPSWSVSTPSLYLATRMMWNVKTDVDALLQDFYTKFYGPASVPMGQYHEALDAAFRDTPYNAGGSFPYIAIFDDARRAHLRGLLDRGAQLAHPANDASYAERIRAVRMGFDRMEYFLDMIAARNRHDYATAQAKMNAVYQLGDRMVEYVLERDHTATGKAAERNVSRLLDGTEGSAVANSYFNRFWTAPVKSGHQRVVEGGELVAGLPDEWHFLLDPTEIGEISGWQRPGPLGGNWQRLKTTSRTWADQGLYYYRGIAWYRTTVTIPEKFRGRKVYLWFGGVDELAKVWVNGQLLGTNREPNEGLPGVPGTFRPFDLDASKAINYGGENTVTVRITNTVTNELGTGGIVAPVMFWSPKDPNWFPGR